MPETDSPPAERSERNWKTAGITLGLIVIGAACLIPLGVSVIFWLPLAVVVAVVMWYGSRRKYRPPPDQTDYPGGVPPITTAPRP
jgi:hypothetical protein